MVKVVQWFESKNRCICHHNCLYTRVSVTRKRVHWGHTHFRVQSDSKYGQLSADLTNNGVKLTQLWVIFGIKLTDFRVIVDLEWSLAPMDRFLVMFDPGVLECSRWVPVCFSWFAMWCLLLQPGIAGVIIHWASKETYHFFRVTFTEIHCIKMIHIWTQIR